MEALKESGHQKHFKKSGVCEKCGYKESGLKKAKTPSGNTAWLCTTCRK